MILNPLKVLFIWLFCFLMACSSQDDERTDDTPLTTTDLKMEELLDGLQNPWGLCGIDENRIMFTERPGKIWIFNLDDGTKTEVTGGPDVITSGQGGLLDVVTHPDFESNGYVYFSYAAGRATGFNTAVGRGVLQGNQMVNFERLFQAEPLTTAGVHFGSRLIFDDQGYLYVSVGDRGNPNWAQDSSNHAGKLLRLNDDGTAPTSNPFYGLPGYAPEIFTMGNRNIQGMDIHPLTREIYTHEHGPQGGDEINRMQAGLNYGWPLVTHGVNYDGTAITTDTTKDGYEDPIHHWTPSVAPCGMAFVETPFTMPNGENLLVGTLAAQHLKGVRLEGDRVYETHRYFEGIGRFRDILFFNHRCFVITEGPGKLYELKEVQ
ncbi:MAG: PQQ-dependent sugar dehydrogenase [Cryomorphaceae bacterium]|nr:PQQ-dependent sugar dehydrogenase [Cryomorphaceae bacterium]